MIKNHCSPNQTRVRGYYGRKNSRENLAESGYNLEWLKKQLDNNRKRLKDVFLGVCDDTGNLKIYQDGKSESKNDIFD